MKEKETLVDKFHNYNGKEFCKQLYKDVLTNSSNYVRFVVVGYVKGSNSFLIGKLKGNYGVTKHFSHRGDSDYIENYVESGNYVYVNINAIEKNPDIKKVRKISKGRGNLEVIDIEELKF